MQFSQGEVILLLASQLAARVLASMMTVTVLDPRGMPRNSAIVLLYRLSICGSSESDSLQANAARADCRCHRSRALVALIPSGFVPAGR